MASASRNYAVWLFLLISISIGASCWTSFRKICLLCYDAVYNLVGVGLVALLDYGFQHNHGLLHDIDAASMIGLALRLTLCLAVTLLDRLPAFVSFKQLEEKFAKSR